jgi:type IV secretory pathway component VirB8
MELDDFFGNKQQDRRFDPDNRYQNSPSQTQNFRYPDQRHNSNFRLEYFLEKLKINRKLKVLVIVAFIVILAIVIALIAILLPLILKLLNYISQNGVQGILDNVTGFLDKLWKGSGK